VLVLLLSLGVAFKDTASRRFGKLGKVRQAMRAFAEDHDFKLEGTDIPSSLTWIDAKHMGREFTLRPDAEHALEVDVEDCPYYLQTTVPGYPPEDVVRFDGPDDRFNTIFPIRYAKPGVIERLKQSDEPLAPLVWFLDRWGDKLARMKIDWSDIEVHLAPGGVGDHSVVTYWLEPEQIEPLFHDTMLLARALEQVGQGKTPNMPQD
jgi:hypothetical protein